MSNGEGPGSKHVPVWGTIASLLWLVLLSVLCLYFLTALWPHPTPSGASPPAQTDTSNTTANKPQPNVNAPSAPAVGGATTPGTSGTTAPVGTTTTTGTTTTAATTVTTASTGTPGTTPANTTTNASPRTPPNASCVECNPEDPDVKAECDCWRRVALMQNYFYDEKSRPLLKNDPTCIYLYGFGGWHMIWGETRLLIIVMLAGFLGSMIYSLRSFFWYTGNRALVWSWLAMYALIPIVGAMMAVVFYLLFRGGLFSPGTTVSDTSPFGFAAISALVGMFTQQSAVKLKTVFETLMAKGEQGSNAAPPTAAPPVLSSVSPMNPPHGIDASITLKGEHFANDATAYGDTTALKTTPVSESELQAVVPASMIPNAGTSVSITVHTGSAQSNAVSITAT
jgi:IPT/TIG domain